MDTIAQPSAAGRSTLRDIVGYGIPLLRFLLTGRPLFSRLMIYTTSRCNSRCHICDSWRRPAVDLSPDCVESILKSRMIWPLTEITLEGGELFLHPDWDRIFSSMNGRPFSIITNGLLTDMIVAAVEKFRIGKVAVSLDGVGKRYEATRGIDGFKKVSATLLRLRDITRVSVIYTPNPYNTRSDYEEVCAFCRDNGLPLGMGMYNSRTSLFCEGLKPEELSAATDAVSYVIKEDSFARLYGPWLQGKVVLPCYSPRIMGVVWPDGNVVYCQGAGLVLGNVNSQSIDEIYASDTYRKLVARYTNCNKCWVAFHRVLDLRAVQVASRALPLPMLSRILGVGNLSLGE